MTRIVVLPSDESACGYYRMRLPAGAVQQLKPDWQIDVYRPNDVMLGTGTDGRLWQVGGIADPDTVDLLIMQRVATPAQLDLIRWFQSKGTAVVVDADDAMWCIDRDNTAYDAWNKGPHHWRWLGEAAEIADMVTVTTTSLAKRYGKHGRAEVLPNCVPGELPSVVQPVRGSLDPTVTIGWAGFTATHPGDLRMVGDAVRRVQADTGCIVRVIGDAEGASRDWGCSVEKVQPTPIGLPYYTALTTLDIGLVPLRDHQFNRAKSYLKALEFAANGVAVVASDTPANRELSRTVPIYLADTPDKWYDSIMALITDPHIRRSRVVSALTEISMSKTYETNAAAWVAVWERAMARRARMDS